MTSISPWQQVQEDFACDHSGSKEIRRRVAADGSKHWYEQCLRCGQPIRYVRTRSVPLAVQSRPVTFDESLIEGWAEARQERLRQLLEDRDARYQSYLASPAWAIKRQRVLDRAGDLCEGCRKRKPVEVHHLTYDRLYCEMLFDLVAVCRPCHETIHDDQPEGE